MKFRPGPHLIGLAALCALAFVASAIAVSGGAPVPASQVAQLVPTPSPSPGGPRRGRHQPGTPGPAPTESPTESPEPLQFSSLDGVWEVEEQPVGQRDAVYSHLDLVQNGTQLTGYWLHDPKNTRSPLTGTFDGRLFSIDVDMGQGKTVTMSGYCENFSDFVGMVQTPTGSGDGTPFTAEHRKKEKPQ